MNTEASEVTVMGMKITPNTALLIAAIIGGLIAIMVIFHPLIGT